MKSHAPTPPLSQNDIINAAIDLLAKCGIDGFSMRTLAEHLGVSPGATYRHIGNKETVLALAAERIFGGIPTTSPDDKPWQDQLSELASAYRRAYALYPGIASYLVLHISDVSANQKLLEYTIAILLKAGLKKNDALRTAAVLNTYIAASVETLQLVTKDRPGRPAARHAERSPTGLNDSFFEYGLSLILRGIEHRE